MKIAVQQMQSLPRDVSVNLERIGQAAAVAGTRGASLLVVPELALIGYGAGDALGDRAETPAGEQARALQMLAGEHKLTMVSGFAERAGSAVYNSALVVDGRGVRLCYRKCQVWGDYERAYFTAAAPSTAIFDHEGLRVGVLICYDVEFPERVRELAMAGAQLIVVPTATPAGSTSRFIVEHMLPVRAFESQVFVAYANHHGHDGRFGYAGQSCIVGPDGQVLAVAAETGDALLLVDIDEAVLAQARVDNTYLQDVVR